MDFLRLIFGIPTAFSITVLLLFILPLKNMLLGKDRGRKFVEGSDINIGKPTGVGIYFMSVFTVCALLFCHMNLGLFFMLILVVASGFFGYLDDIAYKAWGEYLKGALDFGVSIVGSLIFTIFFGSDVVLAISGISFTINPIIYVILAMVLFVVSINATNATDGVDGLSGTLSILSILTIMIISSIRGYMSFNGVLLGLLLVTVIAAYLIFNIHPSKMLMGDAGSRSIGFFIAFYAMYAKIPFAYLIICLPFLIDGGLSILKITIGRITDKVFHKKIIILKNTLTPIHDHLKKIKGFSIKKTWLVISGFGLAIDLLFIVLVGIISLIQSI